MRGSHWSVFLPPNDEEFSNNWSSSRGSNAECPSLAKIDSTSKTSLNSLPICNKSRHLLMRTRLTQPNILSQQEIRPLTSDAQSPCTYLSVFYPRTSTDRTVPHDIHRCQWANCNQKFVFMDQLVGHVNEKHVRVGRSEVEYQCKWEGCPRDGKGFNARYKMLIHIRTHTNEKPHKCLLCGKCFSRLENLKIHKRSHTGEKPYSCPVPGCNKAYSNSSDRFKHVRTHQEKKPYLCKMPGCSKRYTDPSSLRKHVRTHGHYFRRESRLTGYHKSLSNMKSVRLQMQDFTMLQNLARLDSSSLTVDAVAEATDGCPKTETRVIQKRSNDKCLDPPSLSSIFTKPFIFRNMAATHKYDPPKVTEQFPTTNFDTFLNSFDTNPQERPLDLSLTKIISIS